MTINSVDGADKELPKRLRFRRDFSRWLLLMVASALLTSQGLAQLPSVTSDQKTEPVTGNESPTTLFPHPPDSRYWLSGQMNFVFQGNTAFHAQYSGAQSFDSHPDDSEGRVLTLYTGFRFTHTQEVLVDVEGT